MKATLGSRSLFPDLEPFSYLNHAAIAPPSQPVLEAMNGWLRRYAAVGVGVFPEIVEQRESLKQKLGVLIGCAAERLALTSATSHGLIQIASCLKLEPEDVIVCFEGEFPANVTPWQQGAKARGASVRMLPQEGLSDEEVLAGLRGLLETTKVRLVAVSLVQFSTGRVMPVAAICKLAHAYGARVCVDGIQGIGVMPVDVAELQVDFLCSGAHKWLMGLEGVGFVYIRPGAEHELEPRQASWLSHENALSFLFEGAGELRYDRPFLKGAGFLEAHSGNAIGCVALEAAVDLLLELGVPQIQAHVRLYNDRLEAGLIERGFLSLRAVGSGSGTLSMQTPAGVDVLELGRRLGEGGVSVSTPDGKLRMSPHWPNPLSEVPRVLALVDALVSS